MKNLDDDGCNNTLSQFVADWMDRLSVWPDGTVLEIRALVKNEHRLKIQIYPNDHNPPHFHIYYDDFSAKYEFSNNGPLVLLSGEMPRDIHRKLEYMYAQNHPFGLKNALIKRWNDTRPDTGTSSRI